MPLVERPTAYNRAMTPNFGAAILAIASFAAACWHGAPNLYAIWVYTFLMASVYGMALCMFMFARLDDKKQCWIPGMNVATIGFAIAFAIPYRKGMLPVDWVGLEVLFWMLPAMNWGLNLWLAYKLLEEVHVRWFTHEERVRPTPRPWHQSPDAS